jgi:hypothetical protein
VASWSAERAVAGMSDRMGPTGGSTQIGATPPDSLTACSISLSDAGGHQRALHQVIQLLEEV